VSNQSRIVRFGITPDGKRSACWRLRSGMAQPELFLERESQGRRWHFSLHESGQWHMKENGQALFCWSRPPEVVPGYTRAIGIVQPVAVAHHDEPAPEDVVLVPVTPEAQAVAFSVYFERPGANLNGWPGKNADGTLFVGRIPMAQGAGTCCIIAKHEPLQPSIPLTGARPSNAELERLRPIAATGVMATTIIGELADGAIGLIDLRADPSVVATVDRALGS
jgi:hypothetical protein